MNATVAEILDERKTWALTVTARRRALKWSQNELARRITHHGKRLNPGTLSRLLNGVITSQPLVVKVERTLLTGEKRKARRRVA